MAISALIGSGATSARVSCVVCAYNEADRIRRILDAVHNHPALAEVIVVNDGSTDDTEAVLNDYPEIRAISYTRRMRSPVVSLRRRVTTDVS